MNVLSKVLVDTRENILSVCLAVLHILRLDRVVRLGSSVAKALLPRRLWHSGSDSKAIEAKAEEYEYEERLPLSPVRIDHNGVANYEAVRALPLSRGYVDGDGLETFEAVVSMSPTYQVSCEDATPLSAESREHQVNSEDDAMVPATMVSARDDLTGHVSASVARKAAAPQAQDEDRESGQKLTTSAIASGDSFGSSTYGGQVASSPLPVSLIASRSSDKQVENGSKIGHETSSLSPEEVGRNDEDTGSGTLSTTSLPMTREDVDDRREEEVQVSKPLPSRYHANSGVESGSDEMPLPPESAHGEPTTKTRPATISSVGGKAYAPVSKTPAIHELKFPGIYIGDLVESKSPWATSSRHLLGKTTAPDEASNRKPGSAGRVEKLESTLEETTVRSTTVLRTDEHAPASSDKQAGEGGSRSEAMMETKVPADSGVGKMPSLSLEESSGLAIAMATPLPDEPADAEDTSPSLDDTLAEDRVASAEKRPPEKLEESGGLAVAMKDELAPDMEPESSATCAELDSVETTPTPTQDHDLREELTEEPGSETRASTESVGDSSLKRKEVTPLLEESSGLAVAMESPLKKRKDEQAPEQEPPVGANDEVHPLRRTHEMEDVLVASHAAQHAQEPPTQPIASFTNPLNLNSSPEAYAMSLISPSSSALRATFVHPTKPSGVWKPEEQQREKRESAQTNDTEDAENDRQWEDSDSSDKGVSQSRAVPLGVKLPTVRSAEWRATARAESEMSDTDGQSVVSTSEDEPWNSEDEEIFNATPPFMNQRVSSAVYLSM